MGPSDLNASWLPILKSATRGLLMPKAILAKSLGSLRTFRASSTLLMLAMSSLLGGLLCMLFASRQTVHAVAAFEFPADKPPRSDGLMSGGRHLSPVMNSSTRFVTDRSL